MAAKATLTVQNERGLHLSSAAEISKLAQRYASNIMMNKEGRVANAKSVLSITALFAPLGTQIDVEADGADENEAIEAMRELFNNKFGEK